MKAFEKQLSATQAISLLFRLTSHHVLLNYLVGLTEIKPGSFLITSKSPTLTYYRPPQLQVMAELLGTAIGMAGAVGVLGRKNYFEPDFSTWDAQRVAFDR